MVIFASGRLKLSGTKRDTLKSLVGARPKNRLAEFCQETELEGLPESFRVIVSLHSGTFYIRIVYGLLAALAVMVAGFWPSFFSNRAQNDALHTVHGVLASGWMLILIIQAFLMARGHLKLHHWIGRLSILWAAGLLISAIMIMVYGISATGERSLPMAWRPILNWLDIQSLVMFAGFYVVAIICAFQGA